MIHNLSISVYLPIYEYKKESRNSGSDNARENKQQTKRPGSRRTDNSVGVYVQPCGDENENYTGNYCSLFFEGFCRGGVGVSATTSDFMIVANGSPRDASRMCCARAITTLLFQPRELSA